MAVNFDANLLSAWYQNRANPFGVNAGSAGTTARNNRTSGQVAPTAPWATNSGVPRANELVKAALIGGRFVNENAAKLDLDGASDDYKKLFALYQGLNTLSGLAEQAGAKGLSSGELSRLQATFARGLTEVGGYADGLKLEQLRLTRGDTFISDKATVGVTSNRYNYVTKTLMTGKSTDEVPAFAGGGTFEVEVKRLGVIHTITVDLADLGAQPKTMGNLVNLINGKLQAEGVVTRFAVNRTPAPPRTVQANGKPVTLPAVGDAFALEVKGDSTEQVTFSAVSRPAVYVTTSAGNPDPDKNTQTKDGVIQAALLKIDPAGATAPEMRLNTANLEGTVGAVRASQTDGEGNLYLLADVTKTVSGQALSGEQDVALLKYDSAGKLIFARTLGAADTASGYSLAVSGDGHVAVAGSVTGGLNGATNGAINSPTGSGKSDSFVTLYDASGNEVWTERRGALGNDEATAVAFGDDNIVYVAGRTQTAMPTGSPLGGWDTYLTAYSTTDKGAPRALFTQQFGTAGNDAPAGIVVDGMTVMVAGNENGYGVLRSFDMVQTETRTIKTWSGGMLDTTIETWTGGVLANSQSTVVATPGAPDATTTTSYISSATISQTALRNLGDLQGGSIAGLKLEGGQLYIAGQTRNAALTVNNPTAAHAGGQDAFAAVLSTDLTSQAADRLAYYGGAGDNTVSGMSVANGHVYLTGSAGNDLPNLTAVGTKDGYFAQLNMATGAVVSSQRLGGKDGIATAVTIAVDASGASDLDIFGLPTGQLNYARSNLVVSGTSARPGDQFQIRTRAGALPVTITLEAKDTLDTLAARIQRATGYSAKVQVVSDGTSRYLKIAPQNDNSTVEIMPGKNGKDLLAALGLAEGVARNTRFVDGKTVTTAPGGTVYGLGLKMDLSLTSKDEIKRATEVLSAALGKIRSAYKDLVAAATPQPAGGAAAANAGPAPAYLRNQIANYQAGLDRLNGGF